MLCHLIFTKPLWVMSNSNPEELAQVQLGNIWQSRDMCKCVFDSLAQTFNQNSSISRQSPMWLTVPISKVIYHYKNFYFNQHMLFKGLLK